MRFMMPSLLVAATFAAIFALAPRSVGQVPEGYVLVGHQPQGGSALTGSLALVEPLVGITTPIVSPGAAKINSSRCVCVDPNDAKTIYTSSALAVIGGVTVNKITLQGNEVTATKLTNATGVSGQPARLAVAGSDLLFTIPAAGATGGLWRLPLTGTAATSLIVRPYAHSIVVLGTKAYCGTFQTGLPSAIIEVDLLTTQTRVLGTSYPAFRGMCTFGSQLLIGDENGDLWIVTVANGVQTLFAQPGKGAIVAVVNDLGSGLPVFATVNKQVWQYPFSVTPVFTSTGAINDLARGSQPTAAFLTFGAGCTGAPNVAPRFVYTALPIIPSPGFTVAIDSAKANAPATLMLGTSRQQIGSIPLPLELTPFQMPGCHLYQNLLVTLTMTSNAAGSASMPLPIPNQSVLIDRHLMGQWFVLDSATNPFGVTSDGLELILH